MTDKQNNYSLILNNQSLSNSVIASDEITDYEQSKTNGFDGETYTMFIATLGVIVQIASFIYQIYSNKSGVNKEDLDDETKITVVGPDGFEFRNVPLSRISELISILKNQS